MIINYIKTAVRAIKKDMQHFLLNLVGFSIGIAAAILMALFAKYELSYDKFQPDSQRVYLANTDYTSVGLQLIASSDYKIAEMLKNRSEVEAIFRLIDISHLRDGTTDLIQIGDTNYRLNKFYAATSNILEFVNLEALSGDITATLSKPNQLAISDKEATRLFGHNQVVGQVLNHKGGQYQIGAVFKDLPENTHFMFDTLVKMPIEFEQKRYGYAYYKFHEGTDPVAFQELYTKTLHDAWGERGNKAIIAKFMNIEDMHLQGKGPAYMKPAGSDTTLQICIGLSVILVLVASINFVNLNIAQSAKRAKEVGVRKALGATKAQITAQFLLESLIIVGVASLLAFSMVELALPHFNQLMDRNLVLDYGSSFMLSSMAVILVVGLLSGLYPALFIASFSAKRVLSGDLVRGGTAIFVRKLTLCLQGALSVGLIIAAASLYQQINLINSLNVGYDKTSRIVVKDLPSDTLYKKQNNQLLTSIRNLPGVQQVTVSNTDITDDMECDFQFTWPNGEKTDGFQPAIGATYYAAETLGFNLLAGRDFSPQHAADWYNTTDKDNRTMGVMVSKRMVELAGYNTPEEVIGLTVREPRYKLNARIVGVIDDVKVGSARQQALPVSVNLGFHCSRTSHIVAKADNQNLASLMNQIEQIIREELHFSDIQIGLMQDDYDKAHKNEHKELKMVSIFSLLAIFLTCLGTFGLASFATLRKQKEIAVRKVLGASRLSIVNQIAKEFLILMAVSILIAFPVSFWLVGSWLTNFNDRIDQSALVYLFAGTSITAITWLTVAILGFKAASVRPSLILRYE